MNGTDKKCVIFENGGQRIFGVLHQPVGDHNAIPGVVICHGFGGNKCGKHRLYVRIANLLAASGVAVLRFDYRGSGDSDGEFNDMDLHSEVSDTVAAVNYLKDLPSIDDEKIALLGRSLGGAIAVLAASQIPQVKALALWAPVYNAAQWKILWEEARKTGGSEILDEEFVAFEGQLTNLAFVHQFFAMDLSEPLKKLEEVPFLHYHGGKDAMVSTQHAQMYETARAEVSGENHFAILEHSDHDFSEVMEQQRLLTETSHWLVEKLNARSSVNG